VEKLYAVILYRVSEVCKGKEQVAAEVLPDTIPPDY
jgi:hypothetical protein